MKRLLFAWIMIVALWAGNASAYEVWMGTHLSTSEMATTGLPSWSTTASKLEGFNVNRAPHDTDPASNNEYRTIFAQFTNSGAAMTEFARSQATRDPDKTDELAFPSIAARLTEIFDFENSFGYDLSIIMFYDERGTFQGTEYLYEWTEIEIQYLRDWLDMNGHADIELMWNVRNNSVRNQQLAVNPLVDSVEIEASTTAFLNNTNNQITFFNWFWTNPATANKRIALQIPRTLDSLNQYKGTRRVAQMIGGHIGYGENGMRSDRLIFLPVTYNDNFPYIPETVSSGTSYTNTLTSICLSLLEQRELFEGRLPMLPTVADADSTVRTIPPTISAIAKQVTSENTATGAIPFTVADADTPVGSLTVTATSSNTALVPNAGFVFGGSGANRTVTITPAVGQQGTTDITVQVGDGMWTDSTTFTLTVGSVLFSGATDASVKDDLAPADQNNATTLLGAGGNSPFVDRCTVFVFQLPDLGPVANPFSSSSFCFNYEAKQGTLKNNDLYGLGRRASATVLGSDYYGQSTTSDPTDATRLQTDILTNGTPLGTVQTSAGGNAALSAWLNAQYASGAGIGDYFFLRLNTTAPKTGINRATLTMSEGGVASPADTRPRLLFTTNSAPAIAAVADVTTGRNTATTAIPFTVSDVETAAASLSVTASSSNTPVVPNGGIVLGGSGANRTVTITPAPGKTGASNITLEVSDGIRTANTTFTLTVFNGAIVNDEMPGLAADADIRDDAAIVNLGADTLVPGRSGPTGGFNRTTVFVFQLPDLGLTADPFTVATLGFNVESVSASPPGVDLYGLGSRLAPNVLAGDYYGETATPDPTDAVLIQSDILTGSSGTGFKNSSAGSALSAYLNTQYDGGNGIGRHVFLRLTTNAPVIGNNRHFITSADAGGTNGPRLSYTALVTDFGVWLSMFTFAPGADLSAAGDADLDGLNNWFEYLFGLDPSDGSSVSPVTSGHSMTAGTFTYTRANPSLTGVTDYQIWTSENMIDWDHDTTAMQMTDGEGDIQVVTVTVTADLLDAPALFVQVRAQ